MRQLETRDHFLKEIDADRSEIKDQMAELENKKSEFLKMAPDYSSPDYSMDNGTLSFRSKTLNQTIKVELDTSNEKLIATVLGSSQDDIALEKALEVFKTFPY